MKLKPLLIAIIALALLATAGTLLKRSKNQAASEQDEKIGQKLLPANALEQTTEINVFSENGLLTLKQNEEQQWVILQHYQLPIDFSRLTNITQALSAAKINRKVTANPEILKRLEFKPENNSPNSLNLKNSEGETLFNLTLGKIHERGGRYIRFNDEGPAYLTDFDTWIDPEPANWFNKNILKINKDTVRKISVQWKDQEPITFSKADKDSTFTTESLQQEESINFTKLNSLLSRLSNLYTIQATALDSQDAIDARAHSHTLVITHDDGVTQTISYGRRPAQPAAEATETTEDAEQITEDSDGPAYVFIKSSEEDAHINAISQKAAFQLSDSIFESFPSQRSDLILVTEKTEALAEPASEGSEEPAQDE